MNLPTIADYAVFGVWDGMLISLWIAVTGVCLRHGSGLLRKAGATDPTLAHVRIVGLALSVLAACAMAASWMLLPHHAPGVWGCLGIIGVVVTCWSTLSFLRQYLRPKT